MKAIKSFIYYITNHIISHIPFFFIRHLFYKNLLGIKIGKYSSIHMDAFFTGRKIHIGNNTIINRQCYLDGRVELFIGNNVSVSPQTMILTLSHDINSSEFEASEGKVKINDRVWIGSRALILPGVEIGEGAVVAAGAVVTRSVKPYSVVAGVPAKVINTRKQDLKYFLNYKPLFDSDII